MPSLSFCCIPVDASCAECDVSMDEKSAPPCTHSDSAHHVTPCLILGKPYMPSQKKTERESVRVLTYVST